MIDKEVDQRPPWMAAHHDSKSEDGAPMFDPTVLGECKSNHYDVRSDKSAYLFRPSSTRSRKTTHRSRLPRP